MTGIAATESAMNASVTTTETIIVWAQIAFAGADRRFRRARYSGNVRSRADTKSRRENAHW